MIDRKTAWDPFPEDESGGTTAPDGGVIFPDHAAFQFDIPAPRAAVDGGPGVSINVDLDNDQLTFASAIDQPGPPAPPETSTPDPVTASLDEARTSSTVLDDLSALYPGIVWPPMSEWGTTTSSASEPAPDTSSAPDTSNVLVQGLGPAGLPWEVTPDFDDDPGWYPGYIPSSSSSPGALRADEGTAPPSAAVTSSGPDEGSITTSLTAAELNEQYPGIVWPANWWLL